MLEMGSFRGAPGPAFFREMDGGKENNGNSKTRVVHTSPQALWEENASKFPPIARFCMSRAGDSCSAGVV